MSSQGSPPRRNAPPPNPQPLPGDRQHHPRMPFNSPGATRCSARCGVARHPCRRPRTCDLVLCIRVRSCTTTNGSSRDLHSATPAPFHGGQARGPQAEGASQPMSLGGMNASQPTATFESLLPSFLDTLIIAWVGGRPRSLTGSWSSPLPGGGRRVHVITAAKPGGAVQADESNEQDHARLLRALAALEVRWWPAVGASPDGRHVELSAVVAGVDRGQAVALGQDHGQLAVFELTEAEQIVVPCADGAGPHLRERQRSTLNAGVVTFAHLDRWWQGHVRASAIAGVALRPRRECHGCGSVHLQDIAYGMPMSMPPVWIATGGCVVMEGQPTRQCARCGSATPPMPTDAPALDTGPDQAE
ncbi:DUF3293 domain-containing protein [Aquihabitans daechungensis]|uniref:DUF3293 domain-containing protein n=1 Tax=Aquihabitans daechungensis TaxID=1052257 RepID=UPI003BA2A3E4